MNPSMRLLKPQVSKALGWLALVLLRRGLAPGGGGVR